MKTILNSIFIVLVLFLAVGCKDRDITQSSTHSKKHIGYYLYDIDTPLVGIEYKCGAIRGTTDKRGAFYFLSRKDCRFGIGAIELKYLYALEDRDNLIVQEDNENVIKLLKALNNGSEDSTIIIDKKTKRAIKKLKIKEVPSSDVILQATIGAINRFISSSVKRSKKEFLSKK